jgi:mono/diheme cytochrome c family protein
MKRVVTALGVLLVVMVAGVVLALAYVRLTGLSARATPGPVETAIARSLRSWAVPSDYRDRANPVPRTEQAVRRGLEHFAGYCASCHANDGSGDAAIGRNLFPPAPDMRVAATQDMTDGELFHIIEEGVRFTGMPAWGDGTPQGEELAWQLVHFIRRLPQLTPEEIKQMERLNPRIIRD